jgi:hypothetical protein
MKIVEISKKGARSQNSEDKKEGILNYQFFFPKYIYR